jgi:hypothetical protein
MTYKASLDSIAKGITLVVILLFIALGQKSFIALLTIENGSSAIFLHVGTLLFFVAILLEVGCFLQNPIHFFKRNWSSTVPLEN